jgi:hypothetical protein
MEMPKTTFNHHPHHDLVDGSTRIKKNQKIKKSLFISYFTVQDILMLNRKSGRISGIRPAPDIRQNQYLVHP